MRKISEKTEFILAFAALVLGLSGIDFGLNEIRVNLGFNTFTLWELGLVVFFFLFFSIYLYALDSIRYGVSFIEDWKIFKFLKRIADLSYLFAIISPLLITLIWLTVLLLNHIPIAALRDNTGIIAMLSSVMGAAVSLLSSWKHIQEKEKIIYEKINEEASQLLLETNKLFEKKNWRLIVVEAFRLLELKFRDRALGIGIEANKISFVRLIHIFLDKEIITKSQAAKLDHVRELRNLAVHSNEKITKTQASYVSDVIDEVVKSLPSTRFAGGYFEGTVIGALSKLFPRHHIFPQFSLKGNKRVDFMAEGPGYTYYIEVKMIESTPLIRKTLRQVQSFLGENERGLLVLPLGAPSVDINDPRIKIVYFDIQNEKFSNQQSVYEWIYDKN